MTTTPTTASTTNTTEQRSCPLLVFQEELRETLTNPDTTTLTLVLSRQNNTSNLSALTNLLQQELSGQSHHRIEHLVITTLSDEASDEPEWTTPAAQNLFIAMGQLLPRLRSLHLEGLGSTSCALEEDDVAIGFPLFLVMLLLVSIPLPKDDTAPRTLVESMTIQNCRFQVPPDPTLAQQCGRLLARVVTHRLTQLQTLVWDERIISSVGSWTTVEEESNTKSGASIVMDLPCVTDAILQLPHLKHLQISGRYPYACGSYDGLERNPMVMGTIHSGAALGLFSRKATSLFLQDVRLGPAALGALANALSDPKCSIQTLHIDLGMSTTPCKSSDNTEWAQQLLKFVTAFKTNTRLKTLDLGISYDQQLFCGSCKIVSQLAQALMGNRTLSTLRLFSNSSTNLPQQQEGTIVAPERNLFNFFDPALPNICNGDPDNNDDHDGDVIMEEGATAITQETHPNFPEEDAAAFVRLLEVSAALKYVRLDDYNILYDDEASQGRWAPLLDYYTDVNIRYDQRHEGMLSSSSSNKKWFQVVATAANHGNAMVAVEATFYWLRQYPHFASAACI